MSLYTGLKPGKDIFNVTKTDTEAIKEKHISSLPRCSVKKGVIKNLTEFKGKHLCQSLFF